jgi:hypothetical protein
VTPPVTQGRDSWAVPDVEALRPLQQRRSRWADVLLHRRRLASAAVLFPLVLWAARTSLPAALQPSPAWWVLLSLIALLSSLALATYVPLARTDERGGASPCAAAAAMFVVLAGPALGTATSAVVSAAPPLLLAAMALGQRLLGASACGPSAR